ncbi:stalk domain-containing protein [Paenibacillus sacheonensis]|uniref:Copper amine oxidase-like N-terminal domain-containing protein n=1 Tax=Paenibacillus sacheonensis TaxID=742054 RepID=A0A7X4YNI6_9BACL|nr:stalk domain-containing protein [Paenibacillus sacheonensis]MBM7565840.1 hypothetical protein [Paenibacillus sacheonensis]NBC68841.1 hypothetical protein [Paenibacillus sacheonensis]
MIKMKRTIAASVLAMALLVPGIAEAKDMMPMETKSSTMMEQDKMMDMNNVVPLRMFAETLGYKIMWDMKDRSITLTYMGTDMNMGMNAEKEMSDKSPMMMSDRYTIKLMLDSKAIMVGMDKKMLKQAPMLMNGKVYISKEVVTMYLLAPFMMNSMNSM